MQVNLNCNSPKPQFGMAIHSNEAVNQIIKKRIKTISQIKDLEKIFENSTKNDLVDVNLLANPDRKSISANIYATNKKSNFYKQMSENFFTKHFGGGVVGFIKKCSCIANEAHSKVWKDIQFADALENNKLFKQ